MVNKIPTPPKIIYVTIFNAGNKEIIGESTNSCFMSLTNVMTVMGVANINSKRLLIYGDSNDLQHTVFSDFPFYLG